MADETIGQRIVRLRKERGLTQRALAGPGCSYSYLSRVEQDKKAPTDRALLAIAERLNTSSYYLRHGSHPVNGVYVVLIDASINDDPIAWAFVNESDADRVAAMIVADHGSTAARVEWQPVAWSLDDEFLAEYMPGRAPIAWAAFKGETTEEEGT